MRIVSKFVAIAKVNSVIQKECRKVHAYFTCKIFIPETQTGGKILMISELFENMDSILETSFVNLDG